MKKIILAFAGVGILALAGCYGPYPPGYGRGWHRGYYGGHSGWYDNRGGWRGNYRGGNWYR